ncbi:hypothetical protein BDZ89DRAFT_1070665 [Hymenopellis radicata]|nr:hypothetical protein BDZ89DRAFT_1070665 [Hymenopellis radicata]
MPPVPEVCQCPSAHCTSPARKEVRIRSMSKPPVPVPCFTRMKPPVPTRETSVNERITKRV